MLSNAGFHIFFEPHSIRWQTRGGAHRMRIAVDATAARSPNHGIGTYVVNLLAELPVAGPNSHYFVYLSGRAAENLRIRNRGSNRMELRTVTGVRPLRLAWEQFVLPLDAARLHCDVLWGCHNTLPAFKTSPQVVTVHDIGMMVLPEYYPESKVAYFRRAVTRAVRQADVVVADSQFTADELHRRLGVAPERMRVVHCGVASRFRVINETDEFSRVRAAYGLPEEFILFVGVPEPKKNLTRVLRAYAGLKGRRAISHKLVIGGGRSYGWKHGPFYELARSLGDDVILTDFISQNDLPAVYNLAELFVFPSLYEGFGLPPLEALACGTPVVASTAASLPEVLGSAAVLVDPGDETELAEAMLQVLTNPDLRARLKALGPAHAGRFTWDKSARQLAGIFREVVAGS